ncbi:putative phosphorylase kinase, gamma catalytic subunit, protein kinase-like domain superfamily [Plasmopara halstedii]
MGCVSSKPNVVDRNAQVEGRGVNHVVANGKATSASTNPNSFEEQYTLGKVIGSGTFSVVRIAVHKPTGQRYAIKCIKRDGLVAEDIEALTTEVAILKQMNHPNIMILHDFFVEDKFYYLVTEYMEGGELFDRIVEKSFYNEREARDLVKLLLEAIKYCHDANIVHRDLKPENLLLTSKDDDASIKLADFGFAKRTEIDNDGLVTACGTPGYVAPEILEGKPYGKTVDIWSIGVITYILLCGYPPFHDDNHNALFKKIKKGHFQFDSPYWDHVSDDAKDLVTQMLVVNPEKRATVDQLLTHRWVTGTEVATVQLTSALEELRRFNARRKFKAAVSTVSTTVGFSKKYSKSHSLQQSPPDEAVDLDQDDGLEVSLETVELHLDDTKNE